MKQHIIQAFLLLLFAFELQGQKIITIERNDSLIRPLKAEEQVYVANKTSSWASLEKMDKLGKFILVGKRSSGYGIDVHAVKLEKLARQLGSNWIKVDRYAIHKKYDSLYVSAYLAPKALLKRLAETFSGNQLVVINDSPNKTRTVQIGGASVTLPPGSYYRHPVNGDQVSFRLGGGMLSTVGSIDFKKSNLRYLKLGGYGLTGPAGGGVGLGVKSPDFAMLNNFTGELHLATLTEYKP